MIGWIYHDTYTLYVFIIRMYSVELIIIIRYNMNDRLTGIKFAQLKD